MKRLLQIAVVGILLLAGMSIAMAQVTGASAERIRLAPGAEPQQVVRLGNFIEVGNDVWMHILALTDFRYQAVHNFDFENAVRDRTPSRNPQSTANQTGDYSG